MAKRKDKSAKVSGELLDTNTSGYGKEANYEDKDEVLLRSVKQEFLADLRAQADWLKESSECSKFYDGNQWTEEEKQALRERGQPDVTINRLAQRVDSIVGIQMQIRVDTKAFARGDRENEVLYVSEKIRDIERDSDFDDEETQAFKDQVVDGRGWYECVKRWDGFRATRLVRRREATDIVKDRFGRRPDMSDWRCVHDTVMTNLQDAIAMFPDYEEKLSMAMDAEADFTTAGTTMQLRPDQYKSKDGFSFEDYSEFCNRQSRRVRITKTYYRTKVRRAFLFAAGQDPLEITDANEKQQDEFKEMFDDAHIVSQWETRLNSITFGWNCILEHLQNIRSFDNEAKFPLIFVPGHTERRNPNRQYGPTRRMMDPQREVNKRRSKLLYRLSTNQVRFIEGAFENEDEARSELQKPDGFIKIRQGFEVIVDKGTDVAPAEFQLLQQATAEIDSAAGSKELEGRSSANSGREFQLRQQHAVNPLREIFGNLRRARRQVAQYHGDEILEEMKKSPPTDAAGNLLAPLTKYDFMVEEAPESLNLNSETFQQLVSLATQVPSIGQQLPLDMVIKVAPLAANVKSEFLDRLKQQQEAQAQQVAMQQQMMALQAQAGGGQPPGA